MAINIDYDKFIELDNILLTECYELKENQLISWTGVLSNSNRQVLVEL